MARSVVALALVAALAACGAGASPATPSPAPSPSGGVVVITQQDHQQTVAVSVGQTVQVMLGDALDWSLTISDPSVLSAEPGVNTLVRGTQLLARARQPGTAVIDGQGKPRCAPGQACIQIIGIFHVSVVVR